jgi:hypothetical protein
MRRALLLTFLACAWTHGALAQSRVVVRPFTGPGAARVRETVVQAIAEADGMQPVINKEVDGAAQALSADLGTEAGRVAIARKLSLSAFVEGDVKQRGATTQVSLRVYDGLDGAQLTDVGIRGDQAAIDHEVRKRFMTELGSALERARPPPAMPEPILSVPAPQPQAPTPPAPTQADSPQEPSAQAPTPEPVARPRQAPVETAMSEPEAEEPHGPLPRALELGAGLLFLTRNYAYRDAMVKLSEHTVAPTPALRLEARWYPAAHFTEGFLSNLGLDLNAQIMWPTDAKKGNAAFKTSGTELGIAARLRIPVSDVSSGHELGLLLGYGGHSFAIANAGAQDPGIPSVAYGFVRLGADGRLMLRKGLALQARLAYLALTGFGELGDRAWFSHTSGGGIDADLSLGFDVSELVALTASGGVTRFFMSLNPRPTDPGISQGRIAGGVTDQYVYGLLGVRLTPF